MYADGAIALGGLGPDREAILLALLYANAEESLIGQTRAAVVVAGGTQNHIIGTTRKGSVAHYIDASEGLPTHQMLGEFERAVLDHFTIESTIGSIVNVFEENTVHGRLDGGSQFLGIDVHDVLGRYGQWYCNKQQGC